MAVGLKLLSADGGSVMGKHGRAFYPVGEWVTTPGSGACVALTGGLFSAVCRGAVIAAMECEEVVHVDDAPEGTVCYRRVRRLAEAPPADLLAECCRADPDATVRTTAFGVVLPTDLLEECCRAAPGVAVRTTMYGLTLSTDLLAECCRADPGGAVRAAEHGTALPADLLAECCRADPHEAVRAAEYGLALPTGILAECLATLACGQA